MLVGFSLISPMRDVTETTELNERALHGEQLKTDLVPPTSVHEQDGRRVTA